ncbi:MAG: glycosyltransferase family 4 protein [Oscillospiraceae bacterium]
MIKVLNIISDTNIGGAGKVLINYFKYCDRKRFEVAVALPKGSELIAPLKELNVGIFEVDGIADKSLDVSSIKKLKDVIRRFGPDIVHTHGSMSGRIAGKQCGKAVIYTRHSAFPVKGYMRHGPGRLLNKLVNEHYADRIIAVSEATAENLTDGGISRELIDIMMNGVDPVARRSPEECAAVRRKYGIEPGDFTAGIMARIEDYKGHMDILDAVKSLADSGRRIKLIIAGTGSYEEEVHRRVTQLGIEKNVVFAGFVSDVAPILSTLDVQLNASWGTEACSIALLEGFSMGIPAVVSDYGGNPGLVDDGVNGYLFKTRDSAQLAERLAALMDDPSLLQKMGIEARRIYLERFTGERFAARIEEIYTKTLEERQNGKR